MLITPAAPPGMHCTVFADKAGMKMRGCCTQDLSCLLCEVVSGVQTSCAVKTGAIRGTALVCHMQQFAGCVLIADLVAGFVTDSAAGFVLHCEFVTNLVRASVHCRPDSGFR